MVLLKQELLNFIQKYFVDVHKPNHCTRLNATCGEDTERHGVVSAERTSGMHLFSYLLSCIPSENWFASFLSDVV
jgi:hypothetical protein